MSDEMRKFLERAQKTRIERGLGTATQGGPDLCGSLESARIPKSEAFDPPAATGGPTPPVSKPVSLTLNVRIADRSGNAEKGTRVIVEKDGKTVFDATANDEGTVTLLLPTIEDAAFDIKFITAEGQISSEEANRRALQTSLGEREKR